MRTAMAVLVLVPLCARAETKCQDCWDESCKDLKAYFKKCGASAVADCPAGQAKSQDTAGNCCWPGQTWTKSSGKCEGEPQCRAGSMRRGQACVPGVATPAVASVPSINWVEQGAFKLAKTETTVGQYQACVRAGACSKPDSDGARCNWGRNGKSSHPVNCVDWNQAVDFCRWAGGRLPTAGEWQEAASNGGATSVPLGRGAERELGEVAIPPMEPWLSGVIPVEPNRKGVMDLAGNVWEWTSTELSGREGATRRAWDDTPATLLASIRLAHGPSDWNDRLGFRCAQ